MKRVMPLLSDLGVTSVCLVVASLLAARFFIVIRGGVINGAVKQLWIFQDTSKKVIDTINFCNRWMELHFWFLHCSHDSGDLSVIELT